MMPGINVPIGPAKVEWGTTPTVFDITKGGIQFQADVTLKDTTVDQHGTTVVKSTIQGRSAQVTVPFALHDLDKLATAIPNATLVTDSVDTTKKKIVVKSDAGYDLTADAKKLVVKPTDPAATANDWITLPKAMAVSNVEYTYDNDNERVVNITFRAIPDTDVADELLILGDETATA